MRTRMAGGGDEWLTAGDVTTYHEWRSITDGLWWRVLLKLRCRQYVSYCTMGMAAAMRDCLFCGVTVWVFWSGSDNRFLFQNGYFLYIQNIKLEFIIQKLISLNRIKQQYKSNTITRPHHTSGQNTTNNTHTLLIFYNGDGSNNSHCPTSTNDRRPTEVCLDARPVQNKLQLITPTQNTMLKPQLSIDAESDDSWWGCLQHHP